MYAHRTLTHIHTTATATDYKIHRNLNGKFAKENKIDVFIRYIMSVCLCVCDFMAYGYTVELNCYEYT